MEKFISSIDVPKLIKGLIIGGGIGAGIGAGLTIYKNKDTEKIGEMYNKTLNFKYFPDIHNCFADIEFITKTIDEKHKAEWENCLEHAISNADKALNVIVQKEKDDIPITYETIALMNVCVRNVIDTLGYMKNFISTKKGADMYDEYFEEISSALYDIYSNTRGDFYNKH